MSENDKINITEEQLIKIYVEQLNEKEQLAYKIAQKQLESSFCMERSVGFLSFKTNYDTKPIPKESKPPKKKIVKKKVVRKLKKVKIVKKE